MVYTGPKSRSLLSTFRYPRPKRTYGTVIAASVAAVTSARAVKIQPGTARVPERKPSRSEIVTVSAPHPYGHRGAVGGDSGAPGKFRACSRTTLASAGNEREHHKAVTSSTKPVRVNGRKSGRLATCQLVTAALSITFTLNRTQKLCSRRRRAYRPIKASCEVIAIPRMHPQARRNQPSTKIDPIPATNARAGHTRERSSRVTVFPSPGRVPDLRAVPAVILPETTSAAPIPMACRHTTAVTGGYHTLGLCGP